MSVRCTNHHTYQILSVNLTDIWGWSVRLHCLVTAACYIQELCNEILMPAISSRSGELKLWFVHIRSLIHYPVPINQGCSQQVLYNSCWHTKGIADKNMSILDVRSIACLKGKQVSIYMQVIHPKTPKVPLHMLLAACPGQQGDRGKNGVYSTANIPPLLTMSHVSVSITR